MNKKERAISAIKFKGVDRIPTAYRGIDYLSRSLMKYLGFNNYSNIEKQYKVFLKELGADFWSNGQCPGAYSFFIPRCNYKIKDTSIFKDSAYFYVLDIKSEIKNIVKYDFNTIVWWNNPPLANIENKSELNKGFLTSKLDYFEFNNFYNKLELDVKSGFKNTGVDRNFLKFEYFKNSSEDFICMGSLNEVFMICCYLRGMEKFLIDLASNIKLAEHIIGEVGEFCIEFNKRELEGFGKKAEWYSMWDDVADQYNLIFKPELFKKYFVPVYNELIKNVKKYNLIFSWHCCGNVNEILPMMIDAGIDIFDVVQTSAKDMELDKIHKKYGSSVCLHGGIDVQNLLVFGKPEDIKTEVKKIINLWGNSGGIILAPSHEALPETPIENILAIYETVKSEMGN